MTFRHWSRVTPYASSTPSWQSAMFLLNSRLGHLSAAPADPVSLRAGASLFPRLRDWFAEFLNVVSLAHLGLLDPPTCVGLRYGPSASALPRLFSTGPDAPSRLVEGRSRLLCRRLLDGGGPPFRCRRVRSADGRRNVRLLSIGYAFRPRLRPRLTLGGRTWPRKPWVCGGGDSRPSCRY